jgi:HK97 family phage portal protein
MIFVPGHEGRSLFHWFGRKPKLEERAATLAYPDATLWELFGAIPAASGVSVTPANAMRCTAVRCAVQTIAEAIGQLPVHVYQRGEEGAKERAPEHPAYSLLHDVANEWTPAADFREQITRDALLWGNGFAFINRIDGRPVELLRLAPETVTVERDGRTGEPLYKVSEGGSHRYVDRADMLHLKAPSLDGLRGESPVMQAREAIGLALVMEQHAARLFGNGARPSGILKFPNKLGDETAKRIRDSWNAAHGGGGNSGRTAVLEDGGDFLALTFSSVDAQFLELWQHVITEISRIFRVPPHMLFELGRATWGNAEEMGASFVTFSLMRWIKAWQGEIRLKLIGQEDRSTFFAEFLVDDLLRADIGKRAEAYSKLIAARVLNPNEARAMENRPPYEGGDEFANPNTTASTPSAEPEGTE